MADGGAEDTLAPITRLLGQWEGEGTSFGKTSSVVHTYERILQDKFVHMLTRSVSETGEVHEDWGFFSYDSDRDKIVVRQFLSEGFVNSYVLTEFAADGDSLTFTTESAESAGGMRARIRYHIRADDEYELVLELASPGKEFTGCQAMVMRRVEGEKVGK
jgi:hypothetical protein